jgi:hypothetical protein
VITCRRRQFLCKRWPIQLAFHILKGVFCVCKLYTQSVCNLKAIHRRCAFTTIRSTIYLHIYSVEQSPSWEANWFSASQEIVPWMAQGPWIVNPPASPPGMRRTWTCSTTYHPFPLPDLSKALSTQLHSVDCAWRSNIWNSVWLCISKFCPACSLGAVRRVLTSGIVFWFSWGFGKGEREIAILLF